MKKTSRILGIITAFVIAFAMPLVPVSGVYAVGVSPTDDYMIRVHLSSFGTPASIPMNAAGSHTIANNGQAISGAFTAAVENGNIRVTAGAGSWLFGSDVTIAAGSINAANLVKVGNGGSFAGDLRLLVKNGGIKIVNHVDMETYLMGVLPYEMSDNWSFEALKAQAVASRTYAYFIMNSRDRASQEHDLVNTTASQVYNGFNASYNNCIAAVQSTAQTILTTPTGENVYASYGASNGGFTELAAASGAASKNFDYLTLKEDSADLTVSLSSNSYSARVQIPKILALADFKNSGAQPYKMLREKFNTAGYNIDSLAGDLTVKTIALSYPRLATPERMFTGADFYISAPGVGELVLSFTPYVDAQSVARPFLNQILALSDKARFPMLVLRDEGANYMLAATRYGHGTGMSQIGAYQRATDGSNFENILAFYYELGSKTQLVRKTWNIISGGISPATPTQPQTPVAPGPGQGAVKVPAGSNLNVRSGPGTNYPVLGSLNNGVIVNILGENGDWYRIRYGNTENAYVSKSFITAYTAPATNPSTPSTPTTPSAPATPSTPTTPSTPVMPVTPTPETPQTSGGTVNAANGLNVRSGPATSYAILGALAKGTAVTITGDSGDWYKINYKNAANAFVSKSYITKAGEQPPAQTPQTPSQATGTVKVPDGLTLNVRSGPGTNNASIGALTKGTGVTILGESGDWYKINYKNAANAYVSKNYITKSGDTSGAQTTKKGLVATQTGYVLNVRSGAGTSNSILGTLAKGASITITGESGDWYQISYANRTAYVSKGYVKLQ